MAERINDVTLRRIIECRERGLVAAKLDPTSWASLTISELARDLYDARQTIEQLTKRVEAETK